ncbi:transposase family protein [Streptomyces sp. NPDC015501]|uniref:transposase family protein n=1 Tax=unclassified Streptomyces TaxID=2593676 RepID=UPI0036FE9241
MSSECRSRPAQVGTGFPWADDQHVASSPGGRGALSLPWGDGRRRASRTYKLTPGQKDANQVLATGRAPVEHGFAHLKNWRVLTKLRTDPARATHLLRALLVLTNLEVNR